MKVQSVRVIFSIDSTLDTCLKEAAIMALQQDVEVTFNYACADFRISKDTLFESILKEYNTLQPK